MVRIARVVAPLVSSSHNATWESSVGDFFLRRGLSGVPIFDGGMVFSLQGGSMGLLSDAEPRSPDCSAGIRRWVTADDR